VNDSDLMIKPAAGAKLFYLDDAGIVFCPATQELHLLNTTAAVIWTLMEEGHDAAGAASALREMYDLDAARAAEFVSTALDEWRRKRLLDGSLDAAESSPIVPMTLPPDRQMPWQPFDAVEEHHYLLLSSCLQVRFSSAAQARMVHPILVHLETPECNGATVVDVVATTQGIAVYRDCEFFSGCGAIDQLAPIVKSLVWQTAMRDHPFLLDLHAGVIGNGTACVIFPAAPGSGKSTLTASLVHAGFEYFSDEVALLRESSFEVYPMPLAICVKTTGVEALADRFPELRGLAIHRRGDGKDVIYLPPPRASLPATSDSRPVAAIVFPRYAAGARTHFSALAKVDSIKRVMDECLVVTPPLDVVKVDALVRWIEKTPCYSLSYGSNAEAVEVVRSVLATAARSRSG